MRRICVAGALGVVLLVSACGGAPKTIAIPKVPPPLSSFINSWSSRFPAGTIDRIDVYGPATRAALVRAAMGYDVKDRDKRSYLVVLQGNFVCTGCAGPHPLIPPHSKIEAFVWSAGGHETDWRIMKALRPGVKKLHRLAKVRVT